MIMKKFFIISSIVLGVCACMKPTVLTQERYAYEDFNQELGKEYADVIEDIKADFQKFMGASGRAANDVNDDPFYDFFVRMDDYKYYRVPIYGLNFKNLREDTCRKDIRHYIIPTDVMCIFAEKDGEIEGRLIAEKFSGKWFAKGTIFEYGKAIGWLRDSLYRAGTTDYKIIQTGSKEWVTYQKNGKDLYFSILGVPYTQEMLRETVLKIKTIKLTDIPWRLER